MGVCNKACCLGVDLGKVETTFPNAICLVIFYMGCFELSFKSVVIEHIERMGMFDFKK